MMPIAVAVAPTFPPAPPLPVPETSPPSPPQLTALVLAAVLLA
jgi:hypothetical protein